MPKKDNSLIFNKDTIKHFKLIVLPGKGLWVAPGFENHYEAAYHLWHDVVCEGLNSLGLVQASQSLKSDGFISQSEIHVLYNQGQPVGLFAYRWLDLRFSATREQSYVCENYPDELIQEIQRSQQKIIMTMGQLMVHPDWRRSKVGICVSELLVGFAVKRLLESPADMLITFTRNNRKTHELGYRYGAKPLIKNHISHSCYSDIIAIYRDKTCPSPISGVQAAVDKLWLQKTNASLMPGFVLRLKEVTL